MTKSTTLYAGGYAVLIAEIDPGSLEPRAWREVGRFRAEPEAVRSAHELRKNDTVARVVGIGELTLILEEEDDEAQSAGDGAAGDRRATD